MMMMMMITDTAIPIKKPYIIIRDNEVRTRMVIDAAISGGRNIMKMKPSGF